MQRNSLILFILFLANMISARECELGSEWKNLCPILEARVNQKQSKMKLTEELVSRFSNLIKSGNYEFIELNRLQENLPKTTIELIMGILFRGVDYAQAELIAAYLQDMVMSCDFENIVAFDNNTSHIIGRKWHEIDYSGENMTWQAQQKKYAKYGISDFRTLENIHKFFPVEEKLPYFSKIYKPRGKCRLGLEAKKIYR